MNVTVYIPTRLLNLIDEEFLRLHGRKATVDEVRRFLENDVAEVYSDNMHSGLDDAIANLPLAE
jgi:hypothetical protein